MKPAPAEPPLDFELLQRADDGAPRSRRAWLWLIGLLALVLASALALVLYLRNFEAEQEESQRTADAQWLEESVRFHFRRLEDDMTVMARRARQSAVPAAPQPGEDGGLLWTTPGVVLAHGWLAAGAEPPASLARRDADSRTHPENALALAVMQDVTRGLRRSAYAGPMLDKEGQATDTVWLAVPLFDKGGFAGNYLAVLAMDHAVHALVPEWFQRTHPVTLSGSPSRQAPSLYEAQLGLPGIEMAMQVGSTEGRPAMVPRLFLGAALLFLLGMLASLLALRRDFVKRQRVESRLQAQVALRKAMENSVTLGLRAWDLQGRIIYVNQAFCAMVGFEPSALMGRSAPLPYWPADQSQELDVVHRHVTSSGTDAVGVEVQFQHSAGRLLDVLVHEAPLYGAHGVQLGWMSSVMDISERKQAERTAARQQDRLEGSGRLVAMGEVASTLAHELNQPLGALSSFANGLLNRLRGGRITLDEVERVAERMEQLSEKAGRIIHRVNAFARRREVSHQRLELAAFLRRVLAQASHRRTTRVEIDTGAGPLWVEADALLLEHAVLNVVANALHWAQQGTRPARVQVEVLTDGAMAGIAVSDSGPGVAADMRSQVFNAFFSASETGMGMGLAICRSVMEAHHGRVDIDDAPLLGGARFTLWLPRTPTAPEGP